MSRAREMRDLVKALRSQGFEVTVARNGHYKVVAEDGRKCQIAMTPREGRGVLNAKSRLRRIVGYQP